MSKATLTFINIGILVLIIAISIYNQQNSTVQAESQKSKVEIYEKDGFRHIKSNGIANHSTGRFPNRGNPNRIRPQDYKFKVPLNPKISSNTSNQFDENRDRRRGGRPPMPPPLFGVAINGIPFDPGTAEAWNNDRRSGWNNEALTGKINLGIDKNNAHVQPTGAYHYHGIPNGLVKKLSENDIGKKMILVGYAADGFPIYSQYGYANPNDAKSEIKKLASSYKLKDGKRPSGPGGKFDGTYLQDFEYVKGSGDLDECNGRLGTTPEYPNGIYHYFLTDTFPFIPRCHKGTPDKSFQKQPPGGRFGRPPRGRRPPRRPF